MNKILNAGALLMACASAQAQGTVNVYGMLDVALGVSKSTDGTTLPGAGTRIAGAPLLKRMDSGVGPGGTRLGFRGEEDLGNGLKAVFLLEHGFALDTGASQQLGVLFGRQIYLALVSAAGWSLSAGRQYTPINIAFSQSEPTNGFYWEIRPRTPASRLTKRSAQRPDPDLAPPGVKTIPS
jgi:predicted porin